MGYTRKSMAVCIAATMLWAAPKTGDAQAQAHAQATPAYLGSIAFLVFVGREFGHNAAQP